MKCEFCGGYPRKNQLIVSFKNYYCPFCGERLSPPKKRKKNAVKQKG